MEITLEAMLKRKAGLEQELDETLSKANAISGAIQDCDYWIAQLSAEAQGEGGVEDVHQESPQATE